MDFVDILLVGAGFVAGGAIVYLLVMLMFARSFMR